MPYFQYIVSEEVTNNGYTYKPTKLYRFSLIGCGATTIIIPDTVIEMESWIFDKKVELLFLSRNCKVIPRGLISDENNESNLRFLYVPCDEAGLDVYEYLKYLLEKMPNCIGRHLLKHLPFILHLFKYCIQIIIFKPISHLF